MGLENPRHGTSLPEAYLYGLGFTQEAGMMPVVVDRKTEALWPPDRPLPWRGDEENLQPPRLEDSDLEDPARFHQRLAAWILKQK